VLSAPFRGPNGADKPEIYLQDGAFSITSLSWLGPTPAGQLAAASEGRWHNRPTWEGGRSIIAHTISQATSGAAEQQICGSVKSDIGTGLREGCFGNWIETTEPSPLKGSGEWWAQKDVPALPGYFSFVHHLLGSNLENRISIP
jgi:hypothetical protein